MVGCLKRLIIFFFLPLCLYGQAQRSATYDRLKVGTLNTGIIMANGATYPCTSFTSAFAAGGIVDARGCTGTISVTSNPLPSPTKPGKLYLGNATFQTTATWTALQGLLIDGSGLGSPSFGPTIIQAVAGFPASSPVIQASGSNAIRFESLGIDCNNQTGAIGVQWNDSEEQSGLRHVYVQGCPNIGLLIGDGVAGHSQNAGPFEDLYLTPGNATTTVNTIGVKVNANSSAFRGIHGMTIDYHTAAPTPTNCMTIATSGTYEDIHIEGCTNGIKIDGTGVILKNIQCAVTVTNCVVFNSGSGNFAWNTQTGGTNLIVDNVHSITLSNATYGAIWPFYYQANTAQGTGGFLFDRITVPEGSAPGQGPATGLDFCYGDSTAHALKCSYDNDTFGTVPKVNAAFTWTGAQTNMPLTTPTISLLTNGTGLQLFNTTTTCTTGASVGATCTTAAITLPVAEADTNYRIACTGKGLTNVPVVIATTNSSGTQFTITIAALTAAAASFTSYDCIAGHN